MSFGWLTVISKIMDIKIVQWAMLILIVCLIVAGVVFQFRYNGLKLSHALLESKYSKLDASVEVQNAKINEANKAYEQYKLNYEQAKQEGERISKINRSNELKLKSFQFKPNSTCDEKVNQTLLKYFELRGKK